MADVRTLYRIQELELDIIKCTKRIKAISAQMEEDEALREAEAKHDEATADYEDASKQARDMEAEIAALVEKREAAEARLYGGGVTNPKELQDMQMEVESLGRRKTVLDDELARLKGVREERGASLKDSEAALSDVRQARESDNRELLAEKEKLSAEVNDMLARRKGAITDIPADIFKIYNRMRAAKSNRPIAVMNENACTICGIEQNYTVIVAINRSEELVHCQNCGRILIRL